MDVLHNMKIQLLKDKARSDERVVRYQDESRRLSENIVGLDKLINTLIRAESRESRLTTISDGVERPAPIFNRRINSVKDI